jgi:hypothetical protein
MAVGKQECFPCRKEAGGVTLPVALAGKFPRFSVVME